MVGHLNIERITSNLILHLATLEDLHPDIAKIRLFANVYHHCILLGKGVTRYEWQVLNDVQ